VPALLTSEITFSIASISSLVPHFKSGKLRPIAVANETRTPLLPDVPTMAEAGPLPGYRSTFGSACSHRRARRGPSSIASTGRSTSPAGPGGGEKRLNSVGLSPVGTTPEHYMEVMKADLVRYAKITKDAHIKPD